MDSDKSNTNGTLPRNWTTFSNLSRDQELPNSNGNAYAIGSNTVTNNSTNNDENDLNDENLDWNFTSQTANNSNSNNNTKTKDNNNNSNDNNESNQQASTISSSSKHSNHNNSIEEMKTNSESIDNTTNNTSKNHNNNNNNDNDSIGNISNGHNINHVNNNNNTNNNHSGDSGRLQLLINSMPISLRSKLAKNSGFGNNVSNSLFNMNASSNAKKVLLITDKRFVSKPISTYLITTIRVAGFKVTKCDDIEQAPLNWKILNTNNKNENNNSNNNKKNDESNQGKIENNSKNVTKKTETLKKRKNGKIENNNNESKNEEFKFEDLDISPTLTDFDIIMIPTQIKDSIWQNTILGNNNNNTNNDNNNNNNNNEISEKAKELASFVENGGVLLLSHFRACEIINGITNNNLKWHETSVRIGKSKLNLPYNVINGVTERAKQQLSNVNDIRGILGVSHDNSIYKCDDFTTIGRYSHGNGIIGYIGHDFNAILAKDWNNILFLLMKKQLIYTNEYKNEMEMKFDFDIAAIKKLKFDDINNDDENDTNTNTTNNNEEEEEDVEWSPFGSDNQDDGNDNNDENGVNDRDGFEIIPDNEDDISDQMEQDSADFPLTNLTAVKEEGNDDDDDDDNGDDEAT